MCLLAICMSSLEKCVYMTLIKTKRQIYKKKKNKIASEVRKNIKHGCGSCRWKNEKGQEGSLEGGGRQRGQGWSSVGVAAGGSWAGSSPWDQSRGHSRACGSHSNFASSRKRHPSLGEGSPTHRACTGFHAPTWPNVLVEKILHQASSPASIGRVLGESVIWGPSFSSPSILAWRSPRTEISLVDYSPRGHKESDTTEQLSLSLLIIHTPPRWVSSSSGPWRARLPPRTKPRKGEGKEGWHDHSESYLFE